MSQIEILKQMGIRALQVVNDKQIKIHDGWNLVIIAPTLDSEILTNLLNLLGASREPLIFKSAADFLKNATDIKKVALFQFIGDKEEDALSSHDFGFYILLSQWNDILIEVNRSFILHKYKSLRKGIVQSIPEYLPRLLARDYKSTKKSNVVPELKLEPLELVVYAPEPQTAEIHNFVQKLTTALAPQSLFAVSSDLTDITDAFNSYSPTGIIQIGNKRLETHELPKNFIYYVYADSWEALNNNPALKKEIFVVFKSYASDATLKNLILS